MRLRSILVLAAAGLVNSVDGSFASSTTPNKTHKLSGDHVDIRSNRLLRSIAPKERDDEERGETLRKVLAAINKWSVPHAGYSKIEQSSTSMRDGKLTLFENEALKEAKMVVDDAYFLKVNGRFEESARQEGENSVIHPKFFNWYDTYFVNKFEDAPKALASFFRRKYETNEKLKAVLKEFGEPQNEDLKQIRESLIDEIMVAEPSSVDRLSIAGDPLP